MDITLLRMGGAWEEVLPEAGRIARKACRLVVSESDFASYLYGVELSVVLTDDAYIRDLNHSYRGKNKPTNVLSFPAHQNMELAATMARSHKLPLVLGDIILAEETITREAKAQHKPVKNHFTHLVIHGCLHLLGFDHESKQEAGIMEPLEIALLEKLHIANPYLVMM